MRVPFKSLFAGELHTVAPFPASRALGAWGRAIVLEEFGAGPELLQPDAFRAALARARVVDGELLIGGPGVARGYAGASGDQQASFWTDKGMRWYRTGDLVKESSSHHGLIFAGRRDRQVKLYGQRVELEEIESRLRPLLGAGVTVTVTANGPLEVRR